MIYIDVYAIWNLLADVALLWLTGYVRRRRARWYRLLAGGACGALWAVLVVCLPGLQRTVPRAVGTLAAGGIMCAAAFGFGGRGSFRRLWLTLLVITWLAGGLIRFLYEQTGAGYYMQMLLYGTGKPPAAFFTAIASLLVFAGFFVGFRRLRAYAAGGRFRVEATVCARGKSVRVRALIDTGNRLRSLTGEPVAVAARPVFAELFGEEAVRRAENFQSEAGKDPPWMYIPYRSIGKKDGLLPAVRTTSITIQKEEGAVCVPNAWLALGAELSCSEGGRQLILPPEW